jgi:hypothetical protein
LTSVSAGHAEELAACVWFAGAALERVEDALPLERRHVRA